MNFDDLQTQIKDRIWRCNELTEERAGDYAALAVHQVKQFLADHGAYTPFRPRPMPPTNPATLAAQGIEL
jgi:hypothetical protein